MATWGLYVMQQMWVWYNTELICNATDVGFGDAWDVWRTTGVFLTYLPGLGRSEACWPTVLRPQEREAFLRFCQINIANASSEGLDLVVFARVKTDLVMM